MAKIPEQQIFDQTITEIKKILEQENAAEPPRNYLGMSQIGDECHRKVFYSFRNAAKKVFPASGVMAVQDGFIQEDLTAFRLRKVPGIELHTTNNGTFSNTIGSQIVKDFDSKNQIGFQLLLGHFRGHCDGVILGILEAPKTWHVWEHKSVNEKKFAELVKLRDADEKSALGKWDVTYYAQAQIYMHQLEMTRHFLTVTTPGGRDIISVRTEFSRKYAESIIAKAQSIIFDNWTIPARLSDKREFYKCKWCEFQLICHDNHFPLVHCKTCRYSEPVKDGERKCLAKDTIITADVMHTGCKQHIYNPALMPVELIEHQDDGCLYRVGKIIFSNTISSGFPDFDKPCDAMYTSEQIFNFVSLDNLIADVKLHNPQIKEPNKKPVKEWQKPQPKKKKESLLKEI